MKRYIAKQQNDIWNEYKLDATVSGFTTKTTIIFLEYTNILEQIKSIGTDETKGLKGKKFKKFKVLKAKSLKS